MFLKAQVKRTFQVDDPGFTPHSPKRTWWLRGEWKNLTISVDKWWRYETFLPKVTVKASPIFFSAIWNVFLECESNTPYLPCKRWSVTNIYCKYLCSRCRSRWSKTTISHLFVNMKEKSDLGILTKTCTETGFFFYFCVAVSYVHCECKIQFVQYALFPLSCRNENHLLL